MTNAEQTELLEQYFSTLAKDPDALPPPDLDAEQAKMAQQLMQEINAAPNGEAFKARLRQRLETEAMAMYRQRQMTGPARLVSPDQPRRTIAIMPTSGWARLGAVLVVVITLLGSIALIGGLINRPYTPAVIESPAGNTRLAAQPTFTPNQSSAANTPTIASVTTFLNPLASNTPTLPTPPGTFDMNIYLTTLPTPTKVPPPTPEPTEALTQTMPVAQIIQRTRAALQPGGISNIVLTRMTEDYSYGTIVTQDKIWYQSPSQWRDEGGIIQIDNGASSKSTRLADGVDLWSFAQVSIGTDQRNSIGVDRLDPYYTNPIYLLLAGPGAAQDLLVADSTCFTSTLQGGGMVADRSAYVVSLTPRSNPGKCWLGGVDGTTQEPPPNLFDVYWVDRDTFFPLRIEQHNAGTGEITWVDEVSSIAYKATISPNLLHFTIPPNATFSDLRAGRMTNASQVLKLVTQEANQFYFASFMPSYLPGNLKLFKVDYSYNLYPPEDGGREQATFSFAPADTTDYRYVYNGVSIEQEEAQTTGSGLPGGIPQTPTTIAGAPAWVYDRKPGANPTDKSSVSTIRNGTRIIISGPYAANELIKVAASLQQVSPGLPPAQQPTPIPLPTPVPTNAP